jgi:hypothetical protein
VVSTDIDVNTLNTDGDISPNVCLNEPKDARAQKVCVTALIRIISGHAP